MFKISLFFFLQFEIFGRQKYLSDVFLLHDLPLAFIRLKMHCVTRILAQKNHAITKKKKLWIMEFL